MQGEKGWTPTQECFERLLKAGAHIEDLRTLALRYGLNWRKQSVSDDRYRLIHERLADEYLEHHPETGFDVALDRTAVDAYDAWCNELANEEDYRRMRKKEGL